MCLPLAGVRAGQCGSSGGAGRVYSEQLWSISFSILPLDDWTCQLLGGDESGHRGRSGHHGQHLK